MFKGSLAQDSRRGMLNDGGGVEVGIAFAPEAAASV